MEHLNLFTKYFTTLMVSAALLPAATGLVQAQAPSGRNDKSDVYYC